MDAFEVGRLGLEAIFTSELIYSKISLHICCLDRLDMKLLTHIFLVLLFTISTNPNLAFSADAFEKRR